MFLKSCFLFTLLFALSYCASIDNVDDLTKQLESQLPAGGVKAAESQAMEIFHQKCLKNADEEAYLNAKNGREEMMTCVSGLVNVNTIKQEIEDAKPTGDLDIVFKKYCDKTPQFKTCIYTFTDKVERCLSENERKNAQTVRNILDSLATFVCHKDGDRIALFIAEGGPECLMANREQIIECANSTMSPAISKSIDINNIPEFKLNKEKCDKIKAFQQCAVEKLETCAEPTTANMFESLIKFILDATTCKNPKA